MSDLTKVSRETQPGTADQDVVESFDGARAAYNAMIGSFATTVSYASETVGQFTDELTVPAGGTRSVVYMRRMNEAGSSRDDTYARLHMTRVAAQQAGDLLRQFGGERAQAMLAHAYAVRAYTIVLLGELYCSGVPMTSAPYGGKLEYTAGYTTEEIFEHALVVLDTGIQVGTDSVPVLTTLQVVRGRALLNLGRYTEAAAAVAQVETGYRATLSYANSNESSNGNFWTSLIGDYDDYVVANAKGSTGLHWLADMAIKQDPRVPVSRSASGLQFLLPIREQKFTPAPITLVAADGIEARLIEAETQLQPADNPSGPWLQTLNALRATLKTTAGVRLLADTTDPGTAAGRIDLLFRERAFWFYLTAHRLGDMRRLIRQYGRLPQEVFPFGLPDGGTIMYGDEYVMTPEPPGREIEVETNPYYRGCFDGNP